MWVSYHIYIYMSIYLYIYEWMSVTCNFMSIFFMYEKRQQLWVRSMGGWYPTSQASWYDNSDTLVERNMRVFSATVLKVPVAHANSTIILTVYAGVRITTVHIICVLTVEIRWWHVFVVCRSCVGKFPVTMWVIQYIVLNIVTWPNLSGCNMSRWKC